MKLHIGSSTVGVAGFLNVDIRAVAGVDVVSHAGRLDEVLDGSVEVIFANAFIEHVFIGHQLAVLREWRRVLRSDGVLVVLGIPDFEAIAAAYLGGAPGIVGERFDLFNVYRYSHGDPEQAGVPAEPGTWAEWDPANNPDAAPPGWLPQLHKSLYDAQYLHALLGAAGFDGMVFRYFWGDEATAVNLGVVAWMAGASPPFGGSRPADVLTRLIPDVHRFLRLDRLEPCPPKSGAPPDMMLDQARRLDGARPEIRQKPGTATETGMGGNPRRRGRLSRWLRR